MKIWTLKTMPVDGPAEVRTGLTQAQAMRILADLMYPPVDVEDVAPSATVTELGRAAQPEDILRAA